MEILRKHEIPFHLTGGVTSAVYGEPRFTQDIDIVLSNSAVRDRLELLLNSLQDSAFMFDIESFTNAVENEKMFQLFDIVESLKLDVYARELIPGELGRSINIEIFPNVVYPPFLERTLRQPS